MRGPKRGAAQRRRVRRIVAARAGATRRGAKSLRQRVTSAKSDLPRLKPQRKLIATKSV